MQGGLLLRKPGMYSCQRVLAPCPTFSQHSSDFTVKRVSAASGRSQGSGIFLRFRLKLHALLPGGCQNLLAGPDFALESHGLAGSGV